MIIYNITTKPAWEIHDEWMEWMKNIHIPDIIGTTLFYEYRIVKLLELDEQDGPTYAFQYYAKDLVDYERYLETYAARFNQQIYERWGERVIMFGSVMEVLH